MSENDRTKWNERYAVDTEPRAPSALVTALEADLPRTGRALDLAGGTGRHARWLAQRGMDVTLLDVSDVALRIAREHADRAGVSLHTMAIDLETQPIPDGPWDLIVSFHFLQRSLFAQFAQRLAPGGLLLFVQPTVSNLQRHPRPGAPFLLDDGELPRLVRDLEVVRYDEGWLSEGRHEARLLARRN